MKTQINPATKSKINYSAAAMVIAGALFATGVIPEEQVETVAAAILTIGGVVIGVCRTFFTKPETPE